VTLIDVVFKCKICPTGNRWKCALTWRKKFRLPQKLSLLCGSRPKSARAAPNNIAHSAPDFIKIRSLLTELQLNAW